MHHFMSLQLEPTSICIFASVSIQTINFMPGTQQLRWMNSGPEFFMIWLLVSCFFFSFLPLPLLGSLFHTIRGLPPLYVDQDWLNSPAEGILWPLWTPFSSVTGEFSPWGRQSPWHHIPGLEVSNSVKDVFTRLLLGPFCSGELSQVSWKEHVTGRAHLCRWQAPIATSSLLGAGSTGDSSLLSELAALEVTL